MTHPPRNHWLLLLMMMVAATSLPVSAAARTPARFGSILVVAPAASVLAVMSIDRNLDRELRQLRRQHHRALGACFLRAARRGLEHEMKVEISIALARQGTVRQVSFDRPIPPVLADCLQRWVRRWRFSPGEPAELFFPVLFRRAGGQ